ncbi:hypothetical protein BN381_640020 [Candidatus Microthrix parvicella RN1]|uniref:Uncharacterized protein n=1 Tax=Candidatus Neomicrothrix parvicella RN1 TaxID=1229780 RepID=R4Z3I2_9ACTN|nr:hypothetical protein BN381_640020 [Candidatus Microthrix parvicella RN1]
MSDLFQREMEGAIPSMVLPAEVRRLLGLAAVP